MTTAARLQKCVTEICCDLKHLNRNAKSPAVEAVVSAGSAGLKAVLAVSSQLPKNADPRDAWDAIGTLAWLIAKRDPKPILNALRQSQKRDCTLISALGAAKGKEVIEVLIDAAGDSDQYVRGAAIDALISRKAKEAIPVLIKAIRDRSSMIQFRAVDAINKMDVFRDSAALPNLRHILQSKQVKQHSIGTWKRAQEAVIRLESGSKGNLVLAATYAWSDIKNSDIAKIVRELPMLRSLDLSETGIGDAGIRDLGALHHLEKLDLRNTAVSQKGIAFLATKMPQLKSLALGGPELGKGLLRLLPRFTSLDELDVAGVMSDDSDAACLASLTSLKSLRLFWMIGDRGIAALTPLTNLESLDLYSSQVTDKGLASLPSMKRLMWLRLTHAKAVTDDAVKFLGRCKTLRTIFLAGTAITRDGVAKLKQLLPVCKIDRANRRKGPMFHIR